MAVKWLDDPEDHDYAAAADFLSMLGEPAVVDKTVAELRKVKPLYRKAKDILRAADLSRQRGDLASLIGQRPPVGRNATPAKVGAQILPHEKQLRVADKRQRAKLTRTVGVARKTQAGRDNVRQELSRHISQGEEGRGNFSEPRIVDQNDVEIRCPGAHARDDLFAQLANVVADTNQGVIYALSGNSVLAFQRPQ